MLDAELRSINEEALIIDEKTRTIGVPSDFLLGVESDEDVERVKFQCQKIVGDDIDLMEMRIYINYQNGNGELGQYLCTDVETSGSDVTFSWLLSRNVLKYQGTVTFIVCAKKANEDGTLTNEWNTTTAQGTVLTGLEATEEVVEKNPDVIEQILTELDAIKAGGGTVDPEQIKQAVNGYLEENPVSGMTAEQEQQLNQNTTDVSDLKSALKQKADIFYTNESQLKDFGQKPSETQVNVDFGNMSDPMDYETLLTQNEYLYVCVRAKEDYWGSGSALLLNVYKVYQHYVVISNNNLFTVKSVKDSMGNYIGGYVTLNCAQILMAIQQMIEKNSYEAVYGFTIRAGDNMNRFDTPWYIGVTTVEPTKEMYEKGFQITNISEDFRNAVTMVIGSSNTPDTEPDLSTLSGKYCLAIGDSYTYALAGESGALTTYNASIGMAGTLNYGIVSSTIRDRYSSDNGYAFKPMVCRVCHIPSKDSSGETLTGEEVPLDREDIGYITFMGGTNDSFTYPDSTGTDLCDGDQTHIYGGVNLILSKLVESYPDVPIIVILQPYYANNTSAEVTDMSGNKNTVDVSTLNSKFMSMTTQVRKQRIVKEVAEFFSKAYKNIHVIDCCFNWFNPLNEEEYAAFWSQADNGLHLSGNGYNQIVNGERYDSISKKINEIFTVNTNNI